MKARHDHAAQHDLIEEFMRYVGALMLAAFRGASNDLGVNADALIKAAVLNDLGINIDVLIKAGLLDDFKKRVYDLKGILGRKLRDLPRKLTWGLKKGMGVRDWESAGTRLKSMLNEYLNPLAEEAAVKSSLLGVVHAQLEQTSNADAMSYADVERKIFAGYMPDTMQSMIERYDLPDESIRQMEAAHADLASNVTGISEKIRDAVRDQVLVAARSGRSVRELASDLFHLKDDRPELKSSNFEVLQRDWHRVAAYELASYHAAGKMSVYESSEKPIYYVFGGSGTCEWCGPRQGTIVRHLPRGKVGDETNDSLRSRGIRDPHTDVAVWIGKNNVGYKQARWRICWPAHPFCMDTGSVIDPELQEYDADADVIRFKNERAADEFIPREFLTALDDERARRRERLDRQEADRASNNHKRDARYYENWRK